MAATTAPASALPAAPGGRSTVMGGEIQKVDMVRDQLMLKVPAGHTIKILFDERTQVFQNGKKISMLDLKPEDHASVETTLDGTAIFALRIHMMTDLPDGELRGRVERFNPSTGELKLVIADTKDAVTIVTTPATPVARVGQSDFTAQKAGFADLIPGSMVDVTFKSGKSGPRRRHAHRRARRTGRRVRLPRNACVARPARRKVVRQRRVGTANGHLLRRLTIPRGA